MSMGIDCVVIADPMKLDYLRRKHAILFNAREKTRDTITLADGMKVYYLTFNQYQAWKLGRIYMFLGDYIMGDDLFYHSGMRIKKDQLQKLLRGE